MRAQHRHTRSERPDGRKPGQRDWGFLSFLTILALAFLMGGGARHDIASLLLLRPLSMMVAGAVFYLAWSKGLLRGSAPLFFLLALIALVIMQLIPLPQSIWQSFPGREDIADAQALMGLGDTVWRPLSLAPARTYNTLFSLAVPLAALLSFAVLDASPRGRWNWQRIPLVLLGFGLVSVIWGALQLIGPDGGPFYTYRITNTDVPVGPFANRNHQAIFLGSLIPLIAWHFLFARRSTQPGIREIGLASMAMIVAVVAALLTGSRAGSAISLGAFTVVMVMLGIGNLSESAVNSRGKARRAATVARLAAPLAAASMAAAITIAWLYSDAAFFNRLQGVDPLADERLKTLPYVWRLLWDFFPVGTGFGSFEFVYKIVEPTDLLSRRYLNQAHNDALQFVLEGGLPALLILAGFAAWFVRRSAALLLAGWTYRFGHRTPPAVSLGIAAALAATVMLLGSIFDYPLRTPLGMAYFATLCGLVATASRERQAPGERSAS